MTVTISNPDKLAHARALKSARNRRYKAKKDAQVAALRAEVAALPAT
jgi:hypothetical protein